MVVRELVTKLGFDVDESSIRRFNRQAIEANNIVSKLVDRVKELGKEIRNFGLKTSAITTLPIALFTRSAIKMGSTAEEIENKFRATFKNLSKEADEWANKFGKTVGRSDIEIRENLSALQAFAIGLGFSNKEAMRMATTLEELSVDFASFNNLTDEEAIQRFISAMSGSGEVLDRFGINIKQNALDQKLVQLGFEKSAKGATEAQKAIARLAIIHESMGKQGAIGDAIRTADSYANSLKRLKRELDKLLKTWGEVLLPLATKIVRVFTKIIKTFNDLPKGVKKAIVWITMFIASIGPLITVLGVLIGPLITLIGISLVVAIVNALGVISPLLTILGSLFFGLQGVILKILTLSVTFKALKFALIHTMKFLLPMLLKFALWSVLIAGVIALIASLINEIYVWTKGGKSLTGILLGPWEDYRDGLKTLIKDIKGTLRALFEGSFDEFVDELDFWSKVFKQFVNDMLDDFEYVWGEGIIDVVRSVLRFILNAFETVVERLGVLFTSPKQYLQKWKDLLAGTFDVKLNKTGQKIAGFIGDIGEKLGFTSPEGQPALAAPAAIGPRQMERSVINNRKARQSLVVNSNVNLTFPQGTPEQQMSLVENQAREVFRDEMSRQINQSLVSNPMDE